MLECTLKQMAVFHAVMSKGTVGEAADLLGMTQPAASLALAEWEKRTGGFCFDRIGRRLVPNARGRSLLDGVSKVMASTHDLEQVIAGRRQIRLRLATSPNIANHLLPGHLGRIYHQEAQTQIDVALLSPPEVGRYLAQGLADIGFSDIAPTGLVAQPWSKLDYVIACSPTDPLAGLRLTVEALAQALKTGARRQWITIAEGGISDPWLDKLVHKLIDAESPTLKLESNDAACQTIAAGGGLALVCQLATLPYTQRASLGSIYLAGNAGRRTIYAISRPGTAQDYLALFGAADS